MHKQDIQILHLYHQREIGPDANTYLLRRQSRAVSGVPTTWSASCDFDCEISW